MRLDPRTFLLGHRANKKSEMGSGPEQISDPRAGGPQGLGWTLEGPEAGVSGGPEVEGQKRWRGWRGWLGWTGWRPQPLSPSS